MQEKAKTENEQKKKYLTSYQVAKRDVIRLEQQLAELRINKLSPSCSIGDGMPHGTEIGDLSDYIALVDELEQKIISRRYERITAFQSVQAAIEELANEREKTLLTYRYLCDWDWERIAAEMGYGIRKIYYIHGDALKHFKICA